MKLFRNRELRRLLLLHAALTGMLALVCACTEIPPTIVILAGGVLFSGLQVHFTRWRYREIEKLSSAIDRILHGQAQVLISHSSEGELSILQSEIHKMTLRLKETTDALQKDKLHLADAIADISHQLRTPLTSLNLTVSLLLSQDLPEEKRLSMTHEMRRTLRRIDWLVESLLKLSRIDAGAVHFQQEPVALPALVAKAIEPLEVAMELKGVSLQALQCEGTFMGDPPWTAEALGNVIKNCVEHTPSGGEIVIRGCETPLYTEIVVRDSGEGFAPSDIPHLFERFYKGKGASAGSIGIGLALARSVIVQQNGTITAGNHRGGGAQFVIRFYKGVI